MSVPYPRLPGSRFSLVAVVALTALLIWPAIGQAAKIWKVTTTNDSHLGACTATNCSLRNAVFHSSAGDTILLKASSSHYLVTLGSIRITHSLVFKGAGTSSTVIDARGKNRVFEITGAPTRTSAYVFENLTITGGKATAFPGGGGILVDSDSHATLDVALIGASLTRNMAIISTGQSCCAGGGGIYTDGGNLAFTHSSVTANTTIVTGFEATTTPEAYGDGGGGIYNNSGSTVVSASKIDGNTATVTSWYCCHGGGGLYENAGTGGGGVTIENGSQVSDNHFTLHGTQTDENGSTGNCCSGGGGVYQDSNSTVTIEHSTFSGNTVKIDSGQCCHGGGAIYLDNHTPATILRSSLDANTVTVNGPSGANTNDHCCSGGGAVATFAGATVNHSSLVGNAATVNAGDCCQGGGAIQNDTGTGHDVIVSSDISKNVFDTPSADGATESGGGAIYEDEGNAAPGTYTNSTFSGNDTNVAGTDQGGGAIYQNDATPPSPFVLASVTMVSNRAPSGFGGGVLVFGSELNVQNSIVALNTASSDANCASLNSSTLVSVGYNLENSPDSCGFTMTGDKVVAASSIKLGSLKNNGGPTQTRALLAGNPAIDAGNPAGCDSPAGNPLPVDQRGKPRPDHGESRCDIGAYEFQDAH